MATLRAQRGREIPGGGEPGRRSGPTQSAALPLPASVGRPVVGRIRPQVDCGRRPAKAAVGDLLTVEADAFVDGHDAMWCELRYRHDAATRWTVAPMVGIDNDRWRGTMPITELGRYRFLVRAAVDAFGTWRRDLALRAEAGQDLAVELQVGSQLIDTAALRARASERRQLASVGAQLQSGLGLDSKVSADDPAWAEAVTLRDMIFSDRLADLMQTLGDPALLTTSDTFVIQADRAKARFSTWYELFPRSASPEAGRHGTFADVEAWLDEVEAMGFDVLYLPPIHPIGRTGRKGPDGVVSKSRGDPGSPWAIGAAEGGHTAVHPELGTLGDFRSLVAAAAGRGIDVAIDLAFQASPDHPWVTEHPQWFRHRPDGTIRYAENPPKRYEDIYPLDFESSDWPGLWHELLGVVRFWISQGVRVFRVDNPHTKPFAFWEWLLTWAKAECPEAIFLSEAFTRPRVMEQLAKVGFTQSYTYFTWRSTKWEIESYLTELTRTELADYFRPNFWPNTPDILTEELQSGSRAAFLSRLVLAATLSASYGLYGPAFELQEHLPRAPGSEEYLRSEKYEIRTWDRLSPRSLSGFIGRVNRIRQEHAALQFNDALTFHRVDNEQIIAYSKIRGDDAIVVIVSLDHRYAQSGWIDLDLGLLGIEPGLPYVMHDLLTDARYIWEGHRNFIKLNPADVPCHIFSLDQSDSPAPVMRLA